MDIEEDLELIMAKALGAESLSKHRSGLSRVIKSMEKNRSALHDHIEYEEMVEVNKAIQTFTKLKNRIESARAKLLKSEKVSTAANSA